MTTPTPESQPRINPLIRFAVERRVTMGMLVVGVLVIGVLSLSRLPLEFLPSFASSDISVWAPYPSSSPEEVERLIVRELEDSLSTLNGLERMSSNASASQARINLSFVEGTEMDLAAVEVRDRIDRVRHRLPSDLERINIRRFQSSDIPVLRLNLSANWEQERLFEFIEDVVQRRLERLEGVANVDVWGVRSRELQINLVPSRLAAHRVEARDIVSLLQQNNVNLSGGYIREGSRKLLVRVVGEIDSVEEIRELPLGGGLKLEDVADVEYEFPERDDWNYVNGDPSVSLAVNKASNANLLAVVERIKDELGDIQRLDEAQGLRVHYFHDSSVDVKKGLSELRNTGIFGAALAVVFMFFFLRRFRMTVLIAISIPLSLVVTFVLMYLSRVAGLSDITINIMSLMGLMLAVGMLVDNSIVVIESVFRHRQELEEDAKTAALRGASEVAMPIICSTLTTICVFVPMIFLQGSGRFSNFMKSMGLTVVIVMVASLLVSLTIVPGAAAVLLRDRRERPHRVFDWVVARYGDVLRFTLRHRLAFTLLVVSVLWGTVQLYNSIERSFDSPSYERQVPIQVDIDRNFSLEETHRLYEELYKIFDQRREELGIADITYRYRRGSGRSRSGDNRFEIFLVDEAESPMSTLEVREKVRALLPVQAGVELKLAEARRGPPGSGGLQIELAGEDSEILELVANEITARLAQLPFIKDVDTSLESGDEEIHVEVQRERALQSGLSSTAVARSISSALSTRSVSYFKSEDDEVGLVVRYREEDRQTLDQLKKMSVVADGVPLPIGSLAQFDVRPGPRSIEREDRRAQLTISIDTAGDAPSFAMMGPVQGVLASVPLPPGYEWSFGRSFRDAQQESQQAGFAFIFALLLIYMIMAALFEHLLQPLTILLSIPFAFIGVGLIMKLANQPRGNSSEMGLVILAGIVVNNAIVLIDHVNQLRREGLPRNLAVVLGGQHRLRPIVMTAVTTILGMSPMVAPFFFPEIFGQLEGRAAFWAPIGLVILGGLTTSTFLTLMIIPTIYTLIDDLSTLFGRVARRSRPSAPKPGLARKASLVGLVGGKGKR